MHGPIEVFERACSGVDALPDGEVDPRGIVMPTLAARARLTQDSKRPLIIKGRDLQGSNKEGPTRKSLEQSKERSGKGAMGRSGQGRVASQRTDGRQRCVGRPYSGTHACATA